jgi:hypothetical protein
MGRSLLFYTFMSGLQLPRGLHTVLNAHDNAISAVRDIQLVKNEDLDENNSVTIQNSNIIIQTTITPIVLKASNIGSGALNITIPSDTLTEYAIITDELNEYSLTRHKVSGLACQTSWNVTMINSQISLIA